MNISPRNFRYALSYVKRHLLREKFFNASTLLILGSITLLMNIFFILYFFALTSLSSLHHRLDILLYLNPSSKESLRMEMYEKLQKTDFIESVFYISGKDSLKKFLDFEEKAPLQELEEWIELPPYLQIKTKEIADQNKLMTWIKKEGYQNLLNKEQNLKENDILANKLSQIQTIFSQLSSFVFIVLMICTTGMMTLSLHHKLQRRSQEYRIMQLVGAKEELQKLPVFLEASILQSVQWVFASFASFVFAYFAQASIQIPIHPSFLLGLFLVEWVFLLGLGLLSAFIALKMMDYDRK